MKTKCPKPPLKALAEATGKTENYIYKLSRGLCRPGLDLSVALQKATGIPCEQWAFPKIHGDPWERWMRMGWIITGK